MAISKIENSKATPQAGIEYILNPKKREACGVINMDSSYGTNPKALGQQMMDTQHLYGKGKTRNERKYYHPKISFDPMDRVENGGILTPEMAGKYAIDLCHRLFPGHEACWAVHGDGESRHIHIILNAVNFETGKKIDMSNYDYRRFKDICQQMCREYGLRDLDWRRATAEKRAQETQPEEPVVKTTVEREVANRGSRSWKDDLREIVDYAAAHAQSVDEFKQILEENDVVLTRFSDSNISYKYQDHKACRGDTLGGDYTRQAIQNTIEHNQTIAPIEKPKKLSSVIERAERRSIEGEERIIGLEERQAYRDFGRVAGIKRAEIDQMCDDVRTATWEERKNAWDIFKRENQKFWQNYRTIKAEIDQQIAGEYARLRVIRTAEWALNPRKRKASLFAAIQAFMYLSKEDSSKQIREHIQSLKQSQRALQRVVKAHKEQADRVAEQLKERVPLDQYIDSLHNLEQDVIKLHSARFGDENLIDTSHSIDLRRRGPGAK